MESLQDTAVMEMDTEEAFGEREEKIMATPKKRGRKPSAEKKEAKAKVPVKAKGGTGKRYTEEQKKEIVGFMKSMGRGGLTAASKKYNVSMLSLSRWAKGEIGGGKRGRPAGSAKVKGKRGRPPGTRATASPALSKKTRKAILKGLERMGHGIELLAQAFSHLT